MELLIARKLLLPSSFYIKVKIHLIRFVIFTFKSVSLCLFLIDSAILFILVVFKYLPLKLIGMVPNILENL